MATEIKKVFYSRMEFEKDLVEITRQLANSKWKPDLILGPARGGLIPGVYLSHFYDVKMEPVNLSLRDFKTDLQKVKIEIDNILQYKNILVIDDIVDSGDTFVMLKDVLLKYVENECAKHYSYDEHAKCMQAHSIKFATCFYNESNAADFKPDFYARKINKQKEDVWIDFWFESFWKHIGD